VPVHDTLKLPAVAQGLAGTQRSFFNLLALRGGERLDGKAEQRAFIVAMQKKPVLDDEARGMFSTLGQWLAQFVVELCEYLPCQLDHVEAGGKLTDGQGGEVMLARAREELERHGIRSVQTAHESEFGQALALALGVLPHASTGAKTMKDTPEVTEGIEVGAVCEQLLEDLATVATKEVKGLVLASCQDGQKTGNCVVA